VVHWIVGNRDTDVNRGVRGFADPSAMGHEDPPTLPLEILQVKTDLLKCHVLHSLKNKGRFIWYLWFHEETLTSMETFHHTKVLRCVLVNRITTRQGRRVPIYTW